MALFLGTYNVPTNKKLIVNGVGVTLVYSNGVVVWRYQIPVGPGGLPTAGAKGHWVDTGKTIKHNHVRDKHGVVSFRITGSSPGYGEKQGSLKSSMPDSGATPATWFESYAIMRWVPA